MCGNNNNNNNNNVREKPTVIQLCMHGHTLLYTYINRHAGTPDPPPRAARSEKKKKKKKKVVEIISTCPGEAHRYTTYVCMVTHYFTPTLIAMQGHQTKSKNKTETMEYLVHQTW